MLLPKLTYTSNSYYYTVSQPDNRHLYMGKAVPGPRILTTLFFFFSKDNNTNNTNNTKTNTTQVGKPTLETLATDKKNVNNPNRVTDKTTSVEKTSAAVDSPEVKAPQAATPQTATPQTTIEKPQPKSIEAPQKPEDTQMLVTVRGIQKLVNVSGADNKPRSVDPTLPFFT